VNLYYANKKANELSRKARSDKKYYFYRFLLSDLLWECEQSGYSVSTDKVTGEISISEKR
jgi:hypothetical protein